MTFYRMEYKSDGEIGTTFPQSQNFDSKLRIESPNHLWNLSGKFPDDAYIPDSYLHYKAKVTDLISSSPIMYPIISGKLKGIIENYRSDGMQYFPTHLLVRGRKLNYWLLNAFEYDYEAIDFTRSEIRSSSDKDSELLDIKSFQDLKELKIKLEVDHCQPKFWIHKLHLKSDNYADILFFDRIYGSKIYLSEKIKKHIESSSCTGIEFVKYNENYP